MINVKWLILGFCCFLSYQIVAQEAISQDSIVDSIKLDNEVLDMSNYDILFELGQAAENRLKYKDAYRYYKYCLALDSTDIDLLNILARTATNLGRAKEAADYFYRALEQDSTNFYANYQLARLYQQLGEYNRAIEQYQNLLEQDPENTFILRNIGDCYTLMELVTGAGPYYFMAYNGKRENAGLARALINTMLHIGGAFVDEALAICDTALYYNPGNQLLRRNKGMALFLSRKYDEADLIYSTLLVEGDSTYNTVKYGGASKYYSGHFLDAVDLLELAYEMDTTEADTHILLGSALSRTIDPGRALSLLDRAEVLLQPEDVLLNQIMQSRGEAYARTQERNKAERIFYDLWQKTGRIEMLSKAAQLSFRSDISSFPSEEAKQRSLFLQISYVNEALKVGRRDVSSYHAFFESIREDMFFRSITEEPLLSPDGKKSVVNMVQIQDLIKQISEMRNNIQRRNSRQTTS
jgi:tetratricopeptide (TPR) repeat protein